MQSNFPICLDHVLESEGSEYTNDPNDPGGPTKWGITIYDARLYIKKNATAEDVKKITKEVASKIYKEKYWDALAGDELPFGLDYTIFDYGVNSGIARSGRVLRQVLKLPTNDWHVTPDVLTAVRSVGTVGLINAVNTERLRFLQGLGTWSHFGRGWGRRVASVRQLSLDMAQAKATMWGFAVPKAAHGPGKSWPASKKSSIEIPDNLQLAMAAMGMLIAIRTRKVDE